MNCARKLKNTRKKNKFAGKSKSKPSNKRHKKSNHVNSHYKAVVLDKIGLESKQPNSAIRKCVRAQLISTGEIITAFIPFDGGSIWIDDDGYGEIMVQRYRKCIGDIPGVKYKVIKTHFRSMEHWKKWWGRCRGCERMVARNHRH